MATKVKKSANANLSSAADVLSELAGMMPTTPVAKGKQKWEMPFTSESQNSLRRWIEAKTVSEPVLKRLENSKDEVNEFCLKEMVTRLFNSKSKPSNPELKLYKEDKTVDHQAVFLMTDKFKYRFPEVPEGISARGHFVNLFAGLGLQQADAERLVDNEVIFSPIMGIVKFNELLQGRFGEGREWIPATNEEQSAGKKIFAFLKCTDPVQLKDLEPLTPSERAISLERDNGITVKAGFYDRVATYVQNVDQLMAVFSVIQPIVYPAYPKFAMSDTPTDKSNRQIAAAADILGTLAAE